MIDRLLNKSKEGVVLLSNGCNKVLPCKIRLIDQMMFSCRSVGCLLKKGFCFSRENITSQVMAQVSMPRMD